MPFRHFVIEPVILYDKFIDDLGLYENYLICIFMNKISKMRKNKGKTISIARIWIGYEVYLASI